MMPIICMSQFVKYKMLQHDIHLGKSEIKYLYVDIRYNYIEEHHGLRYSFTFPSFQAFGTFCSSLSELYKYRN